MFDFVRLAAPSIHSTSSGRPWRTVRAVLDTREGSGGIDRDGTARTPFLSNSNGVINMSDVSDSPSRTALAVAMSCASDSTTVVNTLRARAKALRISGAAGKDTTSVAEAFEDLATRIATIEGHNAFVIAQAAHLIAERAGVLA